MQARGRAQLRGRREDDAVPRRDREPRRSSTPRSRTSRRRSPTPASACCAAISPTPRRCASAAPSSTAARASGRSLSLYGAAAYTDGRYLTFTDAPPPLEDTGGPQFEDISGSLLPGISKWAFSVGGEATHARTRCFGRAGEFFAAVDASYRSSFSSSATYSQYLVVPGYSLLNARVGLPRRRRLDAVGVVAQPAEQGLLRVCSPPRPATPASSSASQAIRGPRASRFRAGVEIVSGCRSVRHWSASQSLSARGPTPQHLSSSNGTTASISAPRTARTTSKSERSSSSMDGSASMTRCTRSTTPS